MAAGKQGSNAVWFFVDGYNVLSAKVKNLTCKVMSKLEDTTGLGDTWDEHTPVGRSSVTLTQAGAFFDTTDVTGSHVAFKDSVPSSPQATERIITFGFAGNAIGELATGLQGAFTSAYDVAAQNEALTKINVEHQISGQRNNGVIVQHSTAKTADWDTDSADLDSTTIPQRVVAISNASVANPTVITTVGKHGRTTGDKVLISGSNSTPTIDGDRTITVTGESTFTVAVNVTVQGTAGSYVPTTTQDGCVGYHQVSAFSGFSGYVLTIRDSADGITYASLLAFPNVTSGPTAQRATATGGVDRYWSVSGDVTGSGSVTPLAVLCRL